MNRPRVVLSALLLALLAVPALALNGITGITVKKEPQLTSVAIKAIVNGDDDSTAVLRIFQRWVGASYDTGMVMVRRTGFGPTTDAAAGNVYEGRILNLAPGRVVEYYIEGIDAGGNLNAFSSGTPDTTSCRQIRQLVATGPVFYVDGTNGNDSNDGTKARPTRTINAALTALAASTNQGASGGIFVAPGEYHERLDLDSAKFPTNGGRAGDALGQRFLEGDGTNRDSTIICGAHPLVETGLYAPGKPLRWKSLGTDSIYFTAFPAATGPADSVQNIVLGWGEYLHRKTSLKALMADSTYAYKPESPDGIGTGELSGWWWSGDTLYVKRRNGRSPSGMVVHAGYLDDLISVQGRNWRIANLTLRFAGGTNPSPYRADVDPNQRGRGILAGVVRSGSGLVVDSCRVYGMNSAALYVIQSALSIVADSVIVANSQFDGLTIGAMAYGASKSRAEEDAGQVKLDSRATSFINNVMTGTFNGVGCSNGFVAADTSAGSAVEIVGNTFTNLSDDAIELDNAHQINTLVYGNRTDGAASCVSIAPIFSGPAFVLYNTFTGFTKGVKAAGGTTGIARFQQNTMTSVVPNSTACDFSPGGTVDGTFFENNVLSGKGFDDLYGSVLIGPGSGFSTTRNKLNWNLSRSGITFPVSVNGDIYTFTLMNQTLGWEWNGLVGSAAFVDSTRANYSAGPSSPLLNRGRRITGVNTGLDGNRYFGSAPEIGSEERKQQ